MKRIVRKLCGILMVGTVGVMPMVASGKAEYPDKPIRIILGVAPGGLIDVSARLIAAQLGSRLGQTIIIDNRAGASTSIGANAVLKAAPDGYTLYYGSAMTASPIFVKSGAVDFAAQMKPVSQTLAAPYYLLVNGKLPATTIQELSAYSKKNPGKLNLGENSPVATMVMHAIAEQNGIDFTPIPYKGSAPALTAMLGGQVEMALDTAATYMPHIKSGKMRALISTGRTRMPTLPEVPTGIEAKVIEFSTGSVLGLWAPPGTPDAIVKRLSDEVASIAKNPEFIAKFREATHVEPLGSMPAELLKAVEADRALYSRVAKRIGYLPQ